MSLSARFAKINNSGGESSIRAVKKTVALNQQKVRRANQIQNRRGLAGVSKSEAASKGKGGVRVKKITVPKRNNGNKAGKGKAGAKKGQKSKGGNRRKSDKAPVPDADSLDKEMGKYWHKAGKGPDPVQEELDNQLDAYRAKK